MTSASAITMWIDTPGLVVFELDLARLGGRWRPRRLSAVYLIAGRATAGTDTGRIMLVAHTAVVVAEAADVSGTGRLLVIEVDGDLLGAAADRGPLRAKPDNHYQWGAGCDGWKLLELPGLSIRQERMPPQTEEVAHLHRRARQLFYAMNDGCVMATPNGELPIPAMSGLVVDPGLPHQMRNPADRDVRFLAISAPASADDRVPVDAPLVNHTGPV